MIVKEHNIINFSIKTENGSRRYYKQEVLEKNGDLIVKIDGVDVSLSEIYHIEIVESEWFLNECNIEESDVF